jgi:hypothetical protein
MLGPAVGAMSETSGRSTYRASFRGSAVSRYVDPASKLVGGSGLSASVLVRRSGATGPGPLACGRDWEAGRCADSTRIAQAEGIRYEPTLGSGLYDHCCSSFRSLRPRVRATGQRPVIAAATCCRGSEVGTDRRDPPGQVDEQAHSAPDVELLRHSRKDRAELVLAVTAMGSGKGGHQGAFTFRHWLGPLSLD